MILQWGYIRVKKAIGEGAPWLFDDATIIHDLNLSARALCSAAQALQDTYAFTTRINASVAGGGTFFQEYAMPQLCEQVLSGKVQIGTLWPLDFSATPQQLQTGGFVAGAPVMGYIRRSLNINQMVPGSLETVAPVPGNNNRYAPWIIGLYPVPASEYKVFIDYAAYHPWMTQPQDPVLLPDDTDVYDAWTAYAIANALQAEGNAVLRESYRQQHREGLKMFQDKIFAQKAQVTPPQWGGSTMRAGTNGLTIVTMAPTAANLSIE